MLALAKRRQHELWFGTRQGELCRVVTNENTLRVEIILRSQRSVTALCEDREGNLWVGTAGEGLRRVKHRRLRLVPWPEAQAASGSPCLFLTPRGELRLVGGDKNLYGWQEGAFVLQNRLPLPDGVDIQTVCQIREGKSGWERRETVCSNAVRATCSS